jgi:copper resistance protein B
VTSSIPGLLPGALILALAASAAAQHQGHEAPVPKPPPQPAAAAEPPKPKEPIPALTDADRAAAFPPAMQGHAIHGGELRFQVLFDELEWAGGEDGGPAWDSTTWIGGDLDRLWLRSEGESRGGRVESAFLDVLWGRKVSRWWDVVGGVRQDVRPGPAQTWIGGGVQGLAPYFFHLEATGYVGAHGRTLFRLEADYELLLTNRLIVAPTVEAELHGQSDPERGVGRGLSTLESGVRLRYEIRREFAPFIGVTWTRSFFRTADLARAAGEERGSARLALGVRTWF